MKISDIALKDMTRSFRSVFALAFMFGVPLLMTGLFFLMFGGSMGEEDAGFGVPATDIVIVNQDRGVDYGNFSFSVGEMMVEIFQQDSVAAYVKAVTADDPAAARAQVDVQAMGVAVIIPAEFTEAVMDDAGIATSAIELYQDPTLTLGPSVVRAILSGFMDSFSGARIAADVATAQAKTAGVALDAAVLQAVSSAYIDWMQSSAAERGESGGGVEVVPPPGKEAAASTSMIANMLTMIMTGMMIFFAFFTGTSGAQTLLAEEEKGTLPRLFSTPTRVRDILTGRFLANALTICVQIVVLITCGRLVFGLRYGALANIVLALVGSVILATSFGIFVMSWVKDTRQANAIFGGLVTVTGMLGMVNVFTMSLPKPPQFTEIMALFVPQGWAVRLWLLAVEGAKFGTLLPFFGGAVVWTIVLFSIGWARFNRRYV